MASKKFKVNLYLGGILKRSENWSEETTKRHLADIEQKFNRVKLYKSLLFNLDNGGTFIVENPTNKARIEFCY